jgi:hypothetical protein
MKLADLQAQFQAALIHGDPAVLDHIPDSPRETKSTLLGVYQTAYVIRLIEVLRTDYEKLHTYMGDERFDTMAKRYLAQNPSHVRSARWVGTAMPKFLKEDAEYATSLQLADLAALETALNDAFDAADDPVLSFDDLAAVPPQDWGDLSFTAHPSVRFLTLATTASKIWSALAEGHDPEPAIADGGETVLVWRKDQLARFRALGAEEAMLWAEVTRGVPFSGLCELAAVFDDAQNASLRAATYLKSWLDGGLLSSSQLSREIPAGASF